MPLTPAPLPLEALRSAFGARLKLNVPLSRYTTAHVGGPAEAFLVANNRDELAETVQQLWALGAPFRVFGSGSNMLVSDAGLAGVAVINRAAHVEFVTGEAAGAPYVLAESGANLGGVARKAALHGLSGMEWAATIPGTVGGAVYGNAGAHGGNVQGSLSLAEILHPQYGRQTWSCDQLEYQYRSSNLKRLHIPAVILSAQIRLAHSTTQDVKARMEANAAHRRHSQPPGASLGSMFKNPPGDYAGRLIEAAGLKGTRMGRVEISPVHANFFVAGEDATAGDVWSLIQMVRQTVEEKFGVALELEIECVGRWNEADTASGKSH
ncbi:MAG: UDP-N-acetylmuramate dehydrogenase [Anaerolineaceae bacterium]|nr:UDP-N-acetylmuramate dehydrogenase [Anaerolineaceae bacterium]